MKKDRVFVQYAEQDWSKVMTCRNCGKEIKEGSHYCPYCGTKNEEIIEQNKSNLKIKSRIKLCSPAKWLVCISQIVLGLIMLDIYNSLNIDEKSDEKLLVFISVALFILVILSGIVISYEYLSKIGKTYIEVEGEKIRGKIYNKIFGWYSFIYIGENQSVECPIESIKKVERRKKGKVDEIHLITERENISFLTDTGQKVIEALTSQNENYRIFELSSYVSLYAAFFQICSACVMSGIMEIGLGGFLFASAQSRSSYYLRETGEQLLIHGIIIALLATVIHVWFRQKSERAEKCKLAFTRNGVEMQNLRYSKIIPYTSIETIYKSEKDIIIRTHEECIDIPNMIVNDEDIKAMERIVAEYR